MENNNKKPIELVFKEDLHQYLLSVGRIDERLPEAGEKTAFGFSRVHISLRISVDGVLF